MSDDIDHLSNIVHHATEAQDYVANTTKDEFRRNRKDQDSVNYKFVVIGEAARKLSSGFRTSHPDIPWSQIIGMRNIVAHQYGRVDPDIVWDAVKTKLPVLVDRLSSTVKRADREGRTDSESLS